jgi:hypothetical protein
VSRPSRQIPVITGKHCPKCNTSQEDCKHWSHYEAHVDAVVELDFYTTVIDLTRASHGDLDIQQGSYRDRVSLGRVVVPTNYEIRPYRRYHQRRYITGSPSHYEFYVPNDATYDEDGWRWSKPNPVTGQRAEKIHYKKGDPHPQAGKVGFRAPTSNLGKLSPGDAIFFQDKQGEWQTGVVGEFEDYRSVRRRVERANRKRMNQHRAFMRRKTLWDYLDAED